MSGRESSLMDFLHRVFPPGSVAGGLATLSLAVVVGLAAGSIRLRGVKLGVAAVFFSALLFSAAGAVVNPDVLQFLRDFALILFVYTIGLQVGPGFLASLRNEGVRLNILAFCVLAGGGVMTAAMVKANHMPGVAGPGLFTGGFATAPGLAAGQEAIRDRLRATPAAASSAVAKMNLIYAVTYPFGLIGPIVIIILLRATLRIDMKKEIKQLADADEKRRPPIIWTDILVTQDALSGTRLSDHETLRSSGVIFSRLLRDRKVTVPTSETRIQTGDIFRVVGRRPMVTQIVFLFGQESTIDISTVPGDVSRSRIIVTQKQVLRQTLRELDLIKRFGVTLTRLNRAGIELTPRAALALKFGDTVYAVGPADGLAAVERLLGNSPDVLNRPQLIPIFVGIVLGVLVGSVPLALPGMSSGIKIGLAGGPMLVAIVLSGLGNVGSIIWYMPASANYLFRDFGMAVFLACIGLQAGGGFFEILLSGHGLTMVAWGACITLLPVSIMALVARLALRMNFVTLAGLISGTMTSSPTLLFANDVTHSDAPSVAYATVYPLSMLVPVFCSQVLATALVS
jgi:putative transport protein